MDSELRSLTANLFKDNMSLFFNSLLLSQYLDILVYLFVHIWRKGKVHFPPISLLPSVFAVVFPCGMFPLSRLQLENLDAAARKTPLRGKFSSFPLVIRNNRMEHFSPIFHIKSMEIANLMNSCPEVHFAFIRNCQSFFVLISVLFLAFSMQFYWNKRPENYRLIKS